MKRKKGNSLLKKLLICCLCLMTVSTAFVDSALAKDDETIVLTDSKDQKSDESVTSAGTRQEDLTRSNIIALMLNWTTVAIAICLLTESYFVFFYQSIRFKVDGICYNGKCGMNFAEWIKSNYNRKSALAVNRISHDVVIEDDMDESPVVGVKDSTIIENGKEYHTR